jgi:large repetitive protein
MIAASALVVAVLASYAGIGLLSLTGTSSLSALTELPGVNSVVAGIGWVQPQLAGAVHVRTQAQPTSDAFSDVSFLNFGPIQDTAGHERQISIVNHSSSRLPLQVSVVGGPVLSAHFRGGGSTTTVHAHSRATVLVSQNPAYAGPFSGAVQISSKGLTPIHVQITGEQAPLPPGAVTATPAANGAVNLSWAPSASVSGVHGYIVERSSDGTTFTPVTSLPNATTFTDHTPSDGSYSYRVLAVADGANALQSAPGPVGTVTADSTAPDLPKSVSVGPQFINEKNVDGVPVTVALPQSTSPSDTITVTLSDGTHSATQTASGGSASITVHVPAGSLTDSPDDATPTIAVSATVTDALGNTSKPVSGLPVVKDTVAPGAPALGDLPTISEANQDSYVVPFETGSPTASTDTFTATAQAFDRTGPTISSDPVPVGAPNAALPSLTAIDDGKVAITGQVTDLAGNTSDQAAAVVLKDTSGPPAPSQLEIAPSQDNPVNVVTPQSAQNVFITATFATAPATDDDIRVFAAQRKLVDVNGDGQTTTFTWGPFDLSSVAAGTWKLGMNQIDGLGNDTWAQTKFTVDNGVQGPDSVGVPAGPNNPAGYVNAATQTAATIMATFAAPTDPADQIALSVDGLSLGTQAGGSDTLLWTGDISSLPDGTLDILGTITDPNGVQTTFHGSLIKDTTPPPAPAVAGVVGPPPNVITPGDASCVNVAVAFNQAPDATDTVTATLSDGTNSVQGSAPAGDGQVTVGCIDASSLAAGPISVTVTVTDVAGNSVTFTGTPASKVACKHDQG